MVLDSKLQLRETHLSVHLKHLICVGVYVFLFVYCVYVCLFVYAQAHLTHTFV